MAVSGGQAVLSPEHATGVTGRYRATAATAALGIVYGDIGTSPLYAFKQASLSAGPLTPATVIGVLSLIFWALVMIVSVKYAILILRADNHGEGGIVALLALLNARAAPVGSPRAFLLVVGLVGAALLYGDGVITPAISVLSAIEGVRLDAPQLAPLVVPLTVAILLALFLVQRKGTGFIGAIFGPVMLVWFVAIGLMGLGGIWREPAVLSALSPLPALVFLFVSANATKLMEGGWFPLGLAILIAFLMMTWRRGANLVEEARTKLRQPEDEFMAALLTAPPLRLRGTAAIFTAATTGVPLALTHQMQHTRVLHERVLLISGLTTQKPYEDPEDRFKVIEMGHGIARLVVLFGFMELPNMEKALHHACLEKRFFDIDFSKLTYYFRRETVLAGDNMDGMAAWRKRLFSAMHLNTHRHAASAWPGI